VNPGHEKALRAGRAGEIDQAAIARASSFRPIRSKGLAHSLAGSANDVEHPFNIDLRKSSVNGFGVTVLAARA
jgi:hypothetical protein